MNASINSEQAASKTTTDSETVSLQLKKLRPKSSGRKLKPQKSLVLDTDCFNEEILKFEICQMNQINFESSKTLDTWHTKYRSDCALNQTRQTASKVKPMIMPTNGVDCLSNSEQRNNNYALTLDPGVQVVSPSPLNFSKATQSMNSTYGCIAYQKEACQLQLDDFKCSPDIF